MRRSHRAVSLLVVLAALVAASVACVPSREAGSGGDLPARTALDDYVARTDPAYRWKLVSATREEGVTVFVVDMVSQKWRSPSEVDRTEWRHWLTIVKPNAVASDTALLFIGGGSNGREPPSGADDRLAGIARADRAVVAELRMIPNQPLTFGDEDRPRKEDDLIAHTWKRFMDTGDPEWVARMPMVKGAVRAMDTVQALLASPEGGEVSIERFVVAGASKRGWTTWLTGAVDPRVRAIVPIVIDVVNVVPSMEHHYATYGFWAPAIDEYERNGIMDRRFHPRYDELIELVDPWFYRHRLTMPKFLINSSGDEFFLPDSSRFYWDGLLGEKLLRYVPNSDHSLDGSDAIQSLEAFFRSIIRDVPRPRFSWTFEDAGSIRVVTVDRPQEVRLWAATNPEARDFRKCEIGEAYTSSPLEDSGGGVYVGRVVTPEKGWTAFFVELSYDVGGPNPLKLTTEVRVVPDTLPFEDRLEELNARLRRTAETK